MANLHVPTPCLWFDGQALEAAQWYCSIFPNSRIRSQDPVMVAFELNGQPFLGLNGGPQYAFTEAVSFSVSCQTQEEIDFYWDTLTEGGEEGPCGWLKDRYGLSWQIVPAILPQLMADPERAPRVAAAFQTMKKFNIEALQNV